MDDSLIIILDRTYQATPHTVACAYPSEDYYKIKRICTHPCSEENCPKKCEMCGSLIDSFDTCQSCFWMYY